MSSATLIPAAEERVPPGGANARRVYTCHECGQALRFSGLGRHRVFFELDDELADHPVMGRVCPQCGYGLPGKNRP